MVFACTWIIKRDKKIFSSDCVIYVITDAFSRFSYICYTTGRWLLMMHIATGLKRTGSIQIKPDRRPLLHYWFSLLFSSTTGIDRSLMPYLCYCHYYTSLYEDSLDICIKFYPDVWVDTSDSHQRAVVLYVTYWAPFHRCRDNIHR